MKRWMIGVFASIVLLVGVLFPTWEQVQGAEGMADDPATAAKAVSQVALEPFKVYVRADHAAAGTSLRNFDSGTIRLRGIPPNSTVVQAYLYWSYITGPSTTCPSGVYIEFQGRTIPSSRFCTGGDPCWGGAALCAYYADVTGLMPGTSPASLANKVINGDYLISRIPSSADRAGQDPWAPAPATAFPKAEGATLFVVYRNASTTGTVYLHHSCDEFFGTLDVSLSLVPAAPSTISFIKFSRWGDDGQVGSSTDASSLSDEQTWFGGPGTCPAGLTQIAGNGSVDNQNSDWNGNDGEPLNQLWDTHTSTNLASLLGVGASNYCVRYVSPLDCLNPIGYALTVAP